MNPAAPHHRPHDRRPPRAHGLAEILTALANRLERLSVSHKNPEQFFLERSELVEELRRLAAGGRR